MCHREAAAAAAAAASISECRQEHHLRLTDAIFCILRIVWGTIYCTMTCVECLPCRNTMHHANYTVYLALGSKSLVVWSAFTVLYGCSIVR